MPAICVPYGTMLTEASEIQLVRADYQGTKWHRANKKRSPYHIHKSSRQHHIKMLKHYRKHPIKMLKPFQDGLAFVAEAVEERAMSLLSETSSNNVDKVMRPPAKAPIPLRTMNVDQPTTVKSLPPEIHRVLLSYLSPGEGVLVSLTCRDLWAKRDVGGSGCIRRLRRETPRP